MVKNLFAKIIIQFIFLTFSVTISAGELVSGATITSITAADSNLEQFTIEVSGGSGPCAGTAIRFPLSSAPSLAAWNQIYSLAMLAMTSGNTIYVFNYLNNDCTLATHFQVFK